MLLSTKNIKLKHPGSRKLLPKYLGPFRVIRVVNPVAYELALPASMSQVHPVFHVSLLAEYRSDGCVQPPPPPIELDEELEYEVEAILDKRTRKRGRLLIPEYLIKWTGYGHEHNSWEPLSNLTHCVESIRAFESARVPGGGGPHVGSRRRARL